MLTQLIVGYAPLSCALKESHEAAKKLEKFEREQKENEKEQARLESQTQQRVIATVFEIEPLPEARAARRLKNRNRSPSKLQNLKKAAGSAAANSKAAHTLLNLDRGKLGRAFVFYGCVWLYICNHMLVIYAADMDPAREREILMPIGKYCTIRYSTDGSEKKIRVFDCMDAFILNFYQYFVSARSAGDIRIILLGP